MTRSGAAAWSLTQVTVNIYSASAFNMAILRMRGLGYGSIIMSKLMVGS